MSLSNDNIKVIDITSLLRQLVDGWVETIGEMNNYKGCRLQNFILKYHQ